MAGDAAIPGAAEIARRTAAGDISPVETVREALARSRQAQERFNCFLAIREREAMAEAEALARRLAAGDAPGALSGVPVAVKDTTPVAGTPNTWGSRIYRTHVPDRDAPVVERLKRAGAIVIAKTTTPEFACSSFTEAPLFGATLNPWNRARTCGGSSGGSAVAVATGAVALAQGSDEGGSIRIPAAWCGVVGLKPALGRVAIGTSPLAFETISHFGPLARTVADCALFLDACAGPDARDPLSLPLVPAGGWVREVDVTALRIAFTPDLGYMAVDDDVQREFSRAIQAMAAADVSLDELSPGWGHEAHDAWFDYWAVLLASVWGHHLDTDRDRLSAEAAELMERGRSLSALELKRIELLRGRMWARLMEVLASHDALCLPTMARRAPLIGASESDYQGETGEGLYLGIDMTCPFNFLGPCPVASVPCGFDDNGVPVGMQIVGRPRDEATVLGLASLVERLIPFSPPS